MNDFAFAKGNPLNLYNDNGKSWRWDTKPDGTGVSYQDGSIIKMEDQDLVLYAVYGIDNIPENAGYNKFDTIYPHPKTITVDGKMDDWVGVASVVKDMTNDISNDLKDGMDMVALHYAIDEEYFYVMVRTKSLPILRSNMGYYFNMQNQSSGGILYFDLFDGGNSSKYAHYRTSNNGNSTEWSSMYNNMIVKMDDVLEIAIPLDILKKNEVFTDKMNFIMVNRIRSTQKDVDDSSSIIQFP